MRKSLRALAAPVCVLAAVACSKPAPPTLAPRDVEVTAIGPTGVTVVVHLEATNPNGVELTARSVTGRAKVGGKWDLGTITVTKPVVLPPHTPTSIDATMTLPWSDKAALPAFVATNGPIPYDVDGTVTVGGSRLNADVPFKVSGTISHRQVIGAALKSIPLVPGITVPRED